MRTRPFIYLVPLLLFAAGCQQSSQCDSRGVVCETYVHRYGVELDPDDWCERGQHGQVISTRCDGVIESKTYDAGVLHGETTYSYPHREIVQKRDVYDQGNLVDQTTYYVSGVPHRQTSHQGPTTKFVVTWYENGAPQAKEEYENELLRQGEYFDQNQQPESTVTDYNGNRTIRDENGQLVSVDEIKDGHMIISRTYHPNGAPASITTHANGVADGERRTYNQGGDPATVETWAKGKQHGNTEVYQNGEKVSDLPYVRGTVNGVERRYGPDQKLVQENTWVQGQLHGPSTTYVNGQKTQTNWYFRGKPVNKATFDVMSQQ